MSETENSKQNQELKSTELTAIIGREKFDLLADVVGPQVFRFGASGIYDDIARVLGGADTAHAAGSSVY